jgi:hypothetical protein
MGSGCSKINNINNNNNEKNVFIIDTPYDIIKINNELLHNYICDIKNLKVFNIDTLTNIQNISEKDKMSIIIEYNLMFEYINSVAKRSDSEL